MRKVPLPDGAKLYLYTAALTALAVGEMSNAAHAVVTVANTLTANAVVVITSEDYPELEGRIARAKAVTADSVTLDGVDTLDLVKFPPGGTVALIPLAADDWQRLPYVPTFGLTGGDVKTGTSSYLDVPDDQEFSTGRNARRLEYTISWKQDGEARAALQASDGLESVHRLQFKDGSTSYYVGELAYDDVPSTEKGNEQTTKSTVLLRGAPTNLAKAA
ncbi:phage tail tube protein [Comamonas thiooxydans]|uniref:phage tail tube protein n=1 Tax=Comamonas thiooxydans TaxID=363952 RepID=UPI0005F7F8A1|nr:phage tail tube protein [Comamonas thiooxydans]CUB01265.1 Phage tail protein [Comamonas thiooxydans]